MGDVGPLEAERLPAAGVELTVEQGQTLPSVEGLGLHPQPLKVAHNIGLHTLQPGAGGGHVLSGDTESDVLGSLNTVVALGNLVFQHPGELGPDAVVLVLGGLDIHLIAAPGAGAAIDKGELERQGAVKVVEERTPAPEDSRLILRRSHGIIDVLVFHGFGEQAVGELTNAVREHPHIRDGLLGGYGGRAITGPDQAFSFLWASGQKHPPFPQMGRKCSASDRASRRGG